MVVDDAKTAAVTARVEDFIVVVIITSTLLVILTRNKQVRLW